MNRKLWIVILIAAVLFAGAYVGSPFWAARQFKNAALGGDVDRLDASVDFPAVRTSLKSQMTVALTERMQTDPDLRNNPFAGLGMMMMPALVDRMVDGFVTPEGIAAVVERGRVEHNRAAAEARPDVNYDYDYRGLDRFAVTVHRAGSAVRDAPGFVFERRGLFSWKLIRLELPPAALAGAGSGN